MNIFLTDPSPTACAHALDDRRVNNQTRETAQLLCTALRTHGCDDPRLMRVAHPHHPVTKWVTASRSNWLWTLEHFLALGAEKSVRYPDNPAHRNWLELRDVLPAMERVLPAGDLRPFVNCARRVDLDVDFTHVDDVTVAYRMYLEARWRLDSRAPAWSHRGEPAWLGGDHALAA